MTLGRVARRAAAGATGLALLASIAVGADRLPARADARSTADAKAQLTAVLARIDAETAAGDRLRAQLSAVLGRIEAGQARIQEAHASLVATIHVMSALVDRIAAEQDVLDRQAALAYMTPQLGPIDAILGTGSVNDFADAIEYLDQASAAGSDALATLQSSRAELDRQRQAVAASRSELAAAQRELQAQAASLADELAIHESTLAQLERDRAAAEALVAAAQAKATQPPPTQPPPKPTPSPSPSPSPTDPGVEAVKAMIRADFGPLGAATVAVALCVADKESSFNPLAENPITGAAGVYQFIPSTWASLSQAAGYGGASAFDAEANVGTAAWTVTNFGWSNWSTTAVECGA